jgi:HAD superfamily hydrolase (TIGR01509 family)
MGPASGVEAVLFDFGGTLFEYRCLRPATHEALVRLCTSARLEPDDRELAAAYIAALRKAYARYLPQPFYLMRDLFRDATLDTIEWLAALRKVSSDTDDDSELLADLEGGPMPIPGTAHAVCDPFLEVTERDLRLSEGVVNTLDKLRARGLRVGVVTNMDTDQLAHLVGVSGLEPHLDFALASEEARSCKPHLGIFAEAVRRAGATPASTLFVGDSVPQDIEGANRAGLLSVLASSRAAAERRSGGIAQFVIGQIPELLSLLGEGRLRDDR